MSAFSSRDPNQIVQYEHDETNNARKVVIVGGDFGIADAVKASLKDLKIELSQQEQKPFTIEKEVIVKQHEPLMIPQIIKEQEVKVIETQKVVFEPKIVEIEKPVIVKEIEVKVIEQQVLVKEVKDLDKLIKMLMIGQAITLGIVLLKSFL